MRLSISDRRRLPVYGGVYFVFKGELLLYIGATGNLRHRWIDHRLLHPFDVSLEITWLRSDLPTARKLIERVLIRQLRPSMNENLTSISRAVESDIYRMQVVVDADERRMLQEVARRAGKSWSNLVREMFHLPPRASAGRPQNGKVKRKHRS